MAEEKSLMYNGKPLVRQGGTIVYGDMSEKYILIMDILSEKEENGEKVPDDIYLSVVESKNQGNVLSPYAGTKKGLSEAFRFGTTWLDMALKSVK